MQMPKRLPVFWPVKNLFHLWHPLTEWITRHLQKNGYSLSKVVTDVL